MWYVQQRFVATVVEERHCQEAHLFDLPGPSVISGPGHHGDLDMGWIPCGAIEWPWVINTDTHIDTETCKDTQTWGKNT